MEDKAIKNNKDQKTLTKAFILGILSSVTTLITAFLGKSTTQIVDCIRRLMEMFSTLMSLILFKHNQKIDSPEIIRKNNKKVMIFTDITFIVSGFIMIGIGIVKYRLHIPHSNIVPGFIISVIGVILNFYFAFKYSQSLKTKHDDIILAQFNLYRIKTVVDSCVALTVGIMIVFPAFKYLAEIDLIASVFVAVILGIQGVTKLIACIKDKNTDC